MVKYSSDEMAAHLKISRWMIYKLVKHKQMPVHHIGSRLIFDLEEVEQWLIDCRNYGRM